MMTPPDPDKDHSPNFHLNPSGCYLSGTVENGRGGDFCEYYFSPASGFTPGSPEKQKIHFTSTPRFDNHNHTPVTSRYENILEPRNLFPNPKLRSPPHYIHREWDGENTSPKRAYYTYALNEGYDSEEGEPKNQFENHYPYKQNYHSCQSAPEARHRQSWADSRSQGHIPDQYQGPPNYPLTGED